MRSSRAARAKSQCSSMAMSQLAARSWFGRKIQNVSLIFLRREAAPGYIKWGCACLAARPALHLSTKSRCRNCRRRSSQKMQPVPSPTLRRESSRLNGMDRMSVAAKRQDNCGTRTEDQEDPPQIHVERRKVCEGKMMDIVITHFGKHRCWRSSILHPEVSGDQNARSITRGFAARRHAFAVYHTPLLLDRQSLPIVA